MLAPSRIKITDTKKSGVLFISILLITVLISISLFLFFSQVPLEQREIFVDTIQMATLLACVGASLITVLRLGSRTSQGRYYLSLVIGLGLWFCAESIWAYSVHSLKIEMPYPSIADFFWLLGYVFLSYHYYRSFRVWKKAKVVKLFSVLVAVFFTSVLIGYLISISLQSSNDEEFDLGTTIVSNLYLLGNGVLLVPAIVIIWSLTKTDIFLLHRILLSLFIIINMLGDVGFVYHEVLVQEEEFIQQEWVWPMVYTISYLAFIVGLIWYNKISARLNKNIQGIVDKQYPVPRIIMEQNRK